MYDLMLDLETYGTRPGCIIRSVGAVMFDPYDAPGVRGNTFYMNVERSSQEKMGLVVSESTEKWWTSDKMKVANDALMKDQRPVKHVIDEFIAFWKINGARRVWGQGANFDDPIFTAVMEKCGREVPWKFWDSRCTRTAYALGGVNFNAVKRVGTHHNALDDAIHQAKCVQMAHANLKEK